MSVPHPGGDPNANLYAQLKRDVLDRVPQISTVEFVPDDTDFRETYRSDIILVDADLRGADLRRADLSNADLSRYVQLENADLRHADLSSADLGDTDLSSGADLDSANVAGTKLP